ncbi:MAG: guanitoxin biosynthesis MATE family efflux transporter GntT [Synechococcales bacterium]|nr:guanitoxin biosynthesis MATE family efflux transporter GntT [Synechococcales bacterium]
MPHPPFVHRFLRLAFINILSNLMVPLAGLVDVAFLGHLTEIRHLAGVAIATVIFNYIYWSFGFLRMGTTGLTAQAVGRGRQEEVWLAGLRSGAIALVLGLGIVLLQVPLRELGFWLLQAEPDVQLAGEAFYNARLWGAPATLVNFVLIGWFLGREQGGKVLILSLVGNSANVVLDYWAIVRLGWGSAGAGLTTAASQYLMLLVGLVLLGRERWPIKWRLSAALWDRSALRRLFSLNGNILIRTLALVTTFALFTNLSSVLGTRVLAANALILQIITFSAYFIDGFAFATESMAGIFKGQGDRRQLVALLWLSGGLSLGTGLVFAIALILQSHLVFGLLTDHTDVLQQVDQQVGWLLPILGFGGVAYMLDGYFLGLTAGQTLRNASLVAAIAGFLPTALLAWRLESEPLLWLALTLFMALRGITLGLRVPATLR